MKRYKKVFRIIALIITIGFFTLVLSHFKVKETTTSIIRYLAIGNNTLIPNTIESTLLHRHRIASIGEHVVIKIENNPNSIVYSYLKLSLQFGYLFNSNVESVFINNGGTISIKCK